ncbi:MAG: hypothetical protein HZA34_00090 [Candidatus Pacebacteria bacterium]|nr:hypothetical protein [Candidatus Paceibacterota bacterium]
MGEVTKKNAPELFQKKFGVPELKGIILDVGDYERKIDLQNLTMEQLRALNELDQNDHTHGRPFDNEDGYLRINVLYNETFGFNQDGEEIGY